MLLAGLYAFSLSNPIVATSTKLFSEETMVQERNRITAQLWRMRMSVHMARATVGLCVGLWIYQWLNGATTTVKLPEEAIRNGLTIELQKLSTDGDMQRRIHDLLLIVKEHKSNPIERFIAYSTHGFVGYGIRMVTLFLWQQIVNAAVVPITSPVTKMIWKLCHSTASYAPAATWFLQEQCVPFCSCAQVGYELEIFISYLNKIECAYALQLQEMAVQPFISLIAHIDAIAYNNPSALEREQLYQIRSKIMESIPKIITELFSDDATIRERAYYTYKALVRPLYIACVQYQPYEFTF